MSIPSSAGAAANAPRSPAATLRKLIPIAGGLLLLASCGDNGADAPSLQGPSLYPAAFEAAQADYVVRCNDGPLRISGVPSASLVLHGASASIVGPYTTDVQLTANRSVEFPWGRTTYSVRCLPTDFPKVTVTRSREPGGELYAADSPLGGSAQRAVVFDSVGTPIWWRNFGPDPRAFQVLPDGRMVSMNNTAGCSPTPGNLSFCATIRWYDPRTGDERTVSSTALALDVHDIVPTSSGTYLGLRYVRRDCAQAGAGCQLSGTGLAGDSVIVDAEVIEFDPASGNVLFRWASRDEALERFFSPRFLTYSAFHDLGVAPFIRGDDQVTYPDGVLAHDVLHINSVDVLGDKLLISMRHLDAVVQVSKTTGLVEWKIGGIDWPGRSLPLRSGGVTSDTDIVTLLGGQHDARYDGTSRITVYDNGSGQGRAGRALKLEVDPTLGVRAVEAVSASTPLKSVCCGSARRTADGWVVSWGGANTVGVYDATGKPKLEMAVDLTTASGAIGFSYRFIPVPAGLLTRETLRADMNR